MIRPMRMSARLAIPGVPENWANKLRWNPIATHTAMKRWCEDRQVRNLALSAMHEAGWVKPVKTDPPATRYVRFELLKTGKYYDDDGAWNAIKPVLDSLKGILVWDDGRPWCQVLEVEQRQAVTGAWTVVTVYAYDPRPSHIATQNWTT